MIEFQPHAVAYLDILGFSKFVEDAEKDSDKLKQLDKLFNDVIPRQTEDIQGIHATIEMKCLSCSDSIVISVPVQHKYSRDYSALIAVSIKSIQIAHAILDMGLLVRGAIAVGNVYRTDSNILGTGYQEAVDGEKNAGNPQIILSKSAEQVFNSYISNGGQRFAFFAKNELGQIILDSIYPQPAYLPDPQGDVNKYFRSYRSTIIKNLTHADPKARAKWLWFTGLFNANIQHSSTIDKSMVINQELPNIEINYLNPPEKIVTG